MNKNEIRKLLKNKRLNQSKDEVLAKSKQIKNRLFQIDEFKKAKNILFYVSYDGEVFTHDAIKDAFIDKKVVVPISNKEDYSLILSKLYSFEDLGEGPYGILEPKKEKIKEISIDEIDLIIVPGIGFDLKGNRIGHGKGFYDRLLKNTNVPIIALAFEFQIIENIPIDSHDKPVDIIITEKRIIYCKNR
ncbi:MAG: 5-formyltetrahydrofolate cyclo-ligase [Candidatus Thermoplasmatota archaeon]|nr:5-formyltetrahydrofolate cyclo-ligase [Candidatus Thermoplasmatota archaeon]